MSNVENQGSASPVDQTTTQSTAPAGPHGTAPAAGQKTTFSSLEEMFKEHPEVRDAMNMGIAQTICQRSKESTDRLKEIRRQAGG